MKHSIPEDSRRISVAACTIPDEADTDSISINGTAISVISDLKDVILEVNKIDLTNKRELTNASSAVLGSWHTTPDPQKLEVLLTMYGRGGPNPDDQDFNISIEDFDKARNYLYSSKIEASEDIDNADENRHSICKHPENKRAEEDSINCMVLNVNKREYYSLSWEEIAEAAEQDEFLVNLKQALLANNHERLKELLNGKKIHCPESRNGLCAIKIAN